MIDRLLKKIIISALCIGLSWPLFAQFDLPGNDPGRIRWSEMRGGTYRLIYPQGMDSLATCYYNELQRFSTPLARSIGFTPGSLQFGKTPVILHAFTPYNNGSVAWTPRRMEFYTMPDPYESLPQPWVTQLAVHEGRHLAQMQFAYKGGLKYPWYVLGEMWPGALAGIYPDPALLEGDAVAAETALTRSGRGRTGDFLNYYHVAFDNGDWRDWYQWRYGSYRHYSPDYYTAGYMIVAGTRYFFNDPAFSRRYFKRVTETPWKLFSFQKTVRSASGQKFNYSWQKIMQGWRDIWQEEAAARAPFDSLKQVSATPSFAVDYSAETYADGKFYATKEGLDRARQVVTFDKDGNEKILRPFAAETGSLMHDPVRSRIYWSETIRDVRWELSGKSIIRYFSTDDHKPHDLTHKGRLFNPCPSPDGEYLSCVEYPAEGGSRVCIISAEDGSTVRTIPAPGDNEQLTETAWAEDTLYALAIGENGYTVWKHDDDGSDNWEALTEPINAKVLYIGAKDHTVEFVSDRTGVFELYNLDTETGEAVRLTSSRYGSTDFVLDEDADSLYISIITPKGKMIFAQAARELRPEKVNLSDVHTYRIADKLSQQEDSLAVFYPEPDLVEPSGPKKYSKLAHLVKFHSWAPIYFNYDEISSMSFDFTYRTASLGATGLFQNELGTAYGFVGYSAHKNPQERASWKHSLHGQFNYSGWYPVIETSFDFNDRNAYLYRFSSIITAADPKRSVSGEIRKAPLFNGNVAVYIPLSFSKGGWLSGFLPQVKYNFTNDLMSTSKRELAYLMTLPREGSLPLFLGGEQGRLIPLQDLTFSARGYVMRPLAPSNVYPSLGIGAEAGYSFRPGLSKMFTPDVYAYLYGYAPGFWHTQGFRLSAMFQQMLHADDPLRIRENHLMTLPRGFDSSVLRYLTDASTQVKLTVDYAVPIYIGDISVMSPVVYIKNLLVIPHTDFTFANGFLFSTGANITVELANFLWLPFDCSVGIRLDVNGGSRWKELKEASGGKKSPLHRVSAGFIFSIDI